MKTFIYLPTLLLALLITNNTYAKIWRVNNTSGVVADFTTIQAAHDAASAGDTIHVEPSATAYSGVTLTKLIVLIGNGYNLSTDTGLQANGNNSNIGGNIYFNSGSQGSSVQGMYINSYLYVQTTNITIRRNLIAYPTYVYANNLTFQDNFVYYYAVYNQVSNLTGINVSNNIFYYYGGISFDATCTGSFYNNTCNASSISCYNFQVNNNILIGGSFTANNNVYFNNIADGTQFGNANGNQQNVSGSNIFTYSGSYTQDTYWQLKPGSPAIGAGYSGVDCGAFGGASPYKLAGIPNVPAIYKLTVPPVGTSNINVTISTRSNN